MLGESALTPDTRSHEDPRRRRAALPQELSVASCTFLAWLNAQHHFKVTGPPAAGRTARHAAAVSTGYYSNYNTYTPNYSYPSSGGGRSSTGGSSRTSRPRWSPSSSTATYSPSEVRALTPVREAIEAQGALPDRYDLFLCHAWDDRRGTAKELHDALEEIGVTVWLSRTSC